MPDQSIQSLPQQQMFRMAPNRPSVGGSSSFLARLLLFIEYAYLLRFQIIAAAILVAALPLGYRLAPSVFTGLFDATGWWSLVLIVWAAFQLAWTVMVTSRLVLRYAPDRFDRARKINLQHIGLRILLLFGLLAVPCVICAWLGSLDLPATGKIFGIVVGLLFSLLMLIATGALHFLLEQPDGDTAETLFPSFGFLQKLRRQTANRGSFWNLVDRFVNLWPPDVTAGLLRDGHLRSGHQIAGLFQIVLLIIYAILGFVFSPDLRKPEHLPAALFFLLFVITLLAWFFSGVAFLLDRFRLPVLTTVGALSLLTGLIHTDHQFSLTHPTIARSTLSAQNVLDAWTQGRGSGRKKTVAIVATAGGGIRAAAWTAEVLTGLQSECGAQDFSNSLVLVSSVSGGSVGSMFFLRRYTADGNLPNDSLKEIVDDAERSSLSAVGWGMLYPDLIRTVPLVGAFVPETRDRGWALENSWVSGWGERPPTLNQWRNAVAHGKLPAAIFNATAVESGQRFLVATTDVPDRGALRFAERFSDWDLPIATAARLSATFTFVSPAARPTGGTADARVHVADGGYYDNSGVVSALEWLKQAADTNALIGYNVLFILIDADPGGAAPGQHWSWQRQITAPIETLANVRTSSQQFRAHSELALAQKWPGLHFDVAPFLYRSNSENPLSWHLNKNQIAEVSNAWNNDKLKDSKQLVYRSLGCRGTQ